MKFTTLPFRPTLTAAAVATLLLSAAPVRAQGPAGGPPPFPHGGPGGPGTPGGPVGGNPLHDLLRELDLTAEQKTAIQATVESTNAQLKAIQLDAQAKTVAAVTTAAGTIRATLTADQQAELDVFLKRLAKQLAKAQAASAAK